MMGEAQKQTSFTYDAGSFANVYYVKLLLKEPAVLDQTALYRKLVDVFHEVDIVSTNGLSMYALKEHEVIYQNDKRVPSMLMTTEAVAFERMMIPSMSLMQCWDCEDGDALLADCHYELMVSDFLAGGLPYRERCEVLAQYIDLLLELLPECIAMYWPHAQKLLPVGAYRTSSWNKKELHFLDGGLLVRFFNLEGSEDKLVDTVGLSAIGLPDLQVHFHTISPDFIIRYVHHFASYLYQAGDIVKDGDTMDGRTAQERWVCHLEDSLLEPERVVLDVEANEFAAGQRENRQLS